MITCPRCAGDGYLDYTCKSCNGSGEGPADGTRCGVCPRSEGVIRDTCDVCDGEGKLLAPSFKIKLSLQNNYLEIEEEENEEQLCLSVMDGNNCMSSFSITIDELLDVAEKVKKMREK